MDKELENFALNINLLAVITVLRRKTVSNCLANVKTSAVGNAKLKLYPVMDILATWDEYHLRRVIYGDEIIGRAYKRYEHHCKKCNHYKFSNERDVK